ncbi:hypothetical protein B0H10DRAFT_2109909 [Mycena sp. CBHHK59/15]|nr:hypothetical protein B0H10DRAFT_2109909 [Mycena sp. CBHHK59/15]
MFTQRVVSSPYQRCLLACFLIFPCLICPSISMIFYFCIRLLAQAHFRPSLHSFTCFLTFSIQYSTPRRYSLTAHVYLNIRDY